MTWIVRIEIDHREGMSMVPAFLAANGRVGIEWQQLLVGDYVVHGRQVVTVERKTAADLARSILDGRLFSQASRLRRGSEYPLLLVEGWQELHDHPHLNPTRLRGALLTVAFSFWIPLLWTCHAKETAVTLEAIGQIAAREPRGQWRPRGIPPRKDPPALTEHMLQLLPNVGPVMARRLLERFGSLRAIANATEQELAAVPGVGSRRAGSIWRAVRS